MTETISRVNVDCTACAREIAGGVRGWRTGVDATGSLRRCWGGVGELGEVVADGGGGPAEEEGVLGPGPSGADEAELEVGDVVFVGAEAKVGEVGHIPTAGDGAGEAGWAGWRGWSRRVCRRRRGGC